MIMRCKKCKSEMDKLEVFPGDICVNCWERKMSKVPLEKIPMPDFTKTIRR